MTGALRRASLVFMALLYVLAGAMHFLGTDIYVQMMPGYLPWHRALVYLSGVCEIVLGAALLVPRLTPLAAWGIIALLVAVFPANLHMALHQVHIAGLPAWLPQPTPQGLWLRLPVQAVLIAWAWLYTRPARPAA